MLILNSLYNMLIWVLDPPKAISLPVGVRGCFHRAPRINTIKTHAGQIFTFLSNRCADSQIRNQPLKQTHPYSCGEGISLSSKRGATSRTRVITLETAVRGQVNRIAFHARAIDPEPRSGRSNVPNSCRPAFPNPEMA